MDPTDSNIVWVAWCDRVGACDSGTDYSLHVRRSDDSGQSWPPDRRRIINAKNPVLALNQDGLLGLVYQQHIGGRWETKLELTWDGWTTAVTPLTLHTAPSNIPPSEGDPYIGDYIRLLSVGADFYGVFCGNNEPNMAHFPHGVAYQRAVDWANQRLLSIDLVTCVPISIDPFFFHWREPPGTIHVPKNAGVSASKGGKPHHLRHPPRIDPPKSSGKRKGPKKRPRR